MFCQTICHNIQTVRKSQYEKKQCNKAAKFAVIKVKQERKNR